MTIKITNCTTENSGLDGVFIGKNAKVEIDGLTSKNNQRYGLLVDENSDTSLNNVRALDNKLSGIHIDDTTLLKEIGLPENTDINQLKELIGILQQAPEKDRKQIIYESFLSGANNITSIASNLIQIVANLPIA
ncbi:right-handed parallel beta-helix repeat-containing protein [Acinetobacter baumannii]|uniref:right-handed parallel beta-helix repeat-containing protein n=1 Tax=Acinetobacter baumannii TaxID=470 RepID=UPI00338DE375